VLVGAFRIFSGVLYRNPVQKSGLFGGPGARGRLRRGWCNIPRGYRAMDSCTINSKRYEAMLRGVGVWYDSFDAIASKRVET